MCSPFLLGFGSTHCCLCNAHVQVKLKAAEDKASVFEKQLDLAQRRLDGLTTSGQTDPTLRHGCHIQTRD